MASGSQGSSGVNLEVRAVSRSVGVIHVAPGHNVTPELRGDDNIIYTKAYKWSDTTTCGGDGIYSDGHHRLWCPKKF